VGYILSITFEPEEIDFTIEKEGWNVYELSDGTTLKIRPIVVKIFKTKVLPPAKGEGVGIAAQNIVVAKARSDKRGTPATGPQPQDAIERAPKTKVSYTEKDEVWNTYLLPGNRRLKLRLIVTSMERAEDLYDMFGNPIYVVSSDDITASEPIT
jgi:hypothetical protein